jgi:hypothetical protein
MAITKVTSALTDLDGGITIDNITIDGTEIDLSSGDLTLDVAGDIILDADGADIRLKDAGTEWGRLVNSSSNFLFLAPVADKDIIFNGVDGSSEITAFYLDMSEAGDAYFNNNLIVGSTGKIYSSGDTDSYLQFNQADTLRAVIGDSTRMIINTTETVFNDDSGNFDFRIETDDNASMFVVDAGSNDIRIGDATSYVSANLQVTQNNGTEKHLIGLSSGGDSTIAGSGQSARFGEGVVACNTTSDGNTLTIPITSQANLWRQYQVEIMVASAEYNGSGAQGKGGTATFGLTSLTSLNIGNVVVTGNISGVTVDSSSMNVLVEFSSAFTSGLNDYEGCVMHYKVIGITPEYFQGWAATLD